MKKDCISFKDQFDCFRLLFLLFDLLMQNGKCSTLVNQPSNELDRSLSSQNSRNHQSYQIIDELSTSTNSSCIDSFSRPVKEFDQSILNSSLLFLVICLVSSVHLPYFILALIDLPTLQLSLFIYVHWFASLLIPLIHVK